MKLYTLTRTATGVLELRAEALVTDKDSRGRNVGTHVETQITSVGYDIGNASAGTKALAAAIMRHYYGADSDPGAATEAARKVEPFLNAFLLHHAMPPGAKYEITSDVIDRWNSLQT